MTDSIDTLLTLLDLEETGADAFRGGSPETSQQRVFGGQVAAQSLAAAGRTVLRERGVHSVHAYFLRPGATDRPITFRVDRTREGATFSTRRVVASQTSPERGERAIFSMSASFHLIEEGLDHADGLPDAPDPEQLPTLAQRIEDDPGAWSDYYRGWSSFDVRVASGPRHPLTPAQGCASHSQVWFRASSPMPDDPLLQGCALTYASDLTLLAVTLSPHGLMTTEPGLQIASLDHALWFHRPYSINDWLLYDQTSPSASAARGLASGRIFTRDGRLVATVMQEGLIRLRAR